MLGHTYASPTYTNPAAIAPMSPTSYHNALTTPMSPTSTYTVPTTNMFAGYTTTPFMPAAQYNLGTSTVGQSVIRGSYPTTYSTVAPATTYSTSVPAGGPVSVVQGG